MSEFDIVKKTKFPNTLETIKKDLSKLGINRGDIVLVHSSMSKIGWVCGDELTIVQALLESVGEEGTIVMPAYNSANTNPDNWSHPPVPQSWRDEIRRSMPAYNTQNTPTRGMGRICECFKNYTGTVRSNHPTVSFCANGKYKDEIVKKHELSYSLGMNTPLGKLYELNAKVLLLGVGYSNCTCMHIAETLLDKPNIIQHGSAVEINGCREWVWYNDIDYNSDCFDEIGQLYEKKHNDVVFGNIGGANCRVLNLKNIVNFTKEFLEENDNMNISFESCIEDDQEVIFNQVKNKINLYETSDKIDINETINQNLKKVENELGNYVKVLCNGKKIGFYNISEADKKIEIKDFYILEEYQNKGFGKKVLNHCIDEAKNKNVPVLYSCIFANDSRQIELFTKCGFTVRELIGETRCVMSNKIKID